jgi:hypothetical protein
VPCESLSRYSESEPWALPAAALAPSVVWQSAQPITELSFQIGRPHSSLPNSVGHNGSLLWFSPIRSVCMNALSFSPSTLSQIEVPPVIPV